MKEIKKKSILVRVSARFELARVKLSGVDCILLLEYDQSNAPFNGHHELPVGGLPYEYDGDVFRLVSRKGQQLKY